MTLLSRYVGRVVLSAMLIVLLLLLGLDLVFSFLGELEDLRGDYQAPQAFAYALFSMPWRMCDMMPVAALIGGIVGLGLLANNSELTVMRAAGISVWQLVWWVLKPSMVLVVATLLLAEYVVPASQQLAREGKARALGEHYAVGELSGYWQKQQDTFVQIRRASTDGILHDLSFYTLNAQGQIIQSQFAVEGLYQSNGQWQLKNVTTSQILPDGTSHSSYQDRLLWRSELTPDFLALVTVSPEYLPPSHLYKYADYLKGQGLSADSYFLEFWKKTLAPIAAMSMVLVACSFIFGPLRSVTMGLRIILGILTGLGFRYIQDFSGYASLIYHFSPLAAAAIPITLSLCWGIVALRRVR